MSRSLVPTLPHRLLYVASLNINRAGRNSSRLLIAPERICSRGLHFRAMLNFNPIQARFSRDDVEIFFPFLSFHEYNKQSESGKNIQTKSRHEGDVYY